MKIYLALHRRYYEACEQIEAARLTVEEITAYIDEHDDGTERDDWRWEEVDMPLTAESPRIVAEAVTP